MTWWRYLAGPLVTVALLGLTAPNAGAGVAGCPVLPADNIWNVRVDGLPVHPRSDDYIDTIGRGVGLHPDFGAGFWDGGPIGIPFVTVPGSQPRVPVSFGYDDESDPGPYPVPPGVPIEGGPVSDGDRHVLVVDRDACVLYELFAAYPQPGGGWYADSGAVFDLRSNALRPETWTSADAAGLPMLPGLARWEEVAAGEIKHALRFTAPVTQRAYVWPARHYASDNTDPAVPPMGQRFRLKASFDISGFPPQVRVILRALQLYGMMLADNGSRWYISGVPDSRWDDDALVPGFSQVKGDDFEAVDVSGLQVYPDSGQTIPTRFADVPTEHWAFARIEAVASAGVTAGCDTAPPLYCPNAPVTREQMAVFLLRAKEGAGYAPPPCTTAPFADVPCSHPFASWIQELVKRGITAGCGAGRYCPGSPVTRGQMAVFLLKTFEGAAYVPAACGVPRFVDVPCADPFARWVEELVRRNVTAGCGGNAYCPASAVTRAQMAVFLVLTFGLPQ
jgi:hypothetical protein